MALNNQLTCPYCGLTFGKLRANIAKVNRNGMQHHLWGAHGYTTSDAFKETDRTYSEQLASYRKRRGRREKYYADHEEK